MRHDQYDVRKPPNIESHTSGGPTNLTTPPPHPRFRSYPEGESGADEEQSRPSSAQGRLGLYTVPLADIGVLEVACAVYQRALYFLTSSFSTSVRDFFFFFMNTAGCSSSVAALLHEPLASVIPSTEVVACVSLAAASAALSSGVGWSLQDLAWGPIRPWGMSAWRALAPRARAAAASCAPDGSVVVAVGAASTVPGAMLASCAALVAASFVAWTQRVCVHGSPSEWPVVARPRDHHSTDLTSVEEYDPPEDGDAALLTQNETSPDMLAKQQQRQQQQQPRRLVC